MDNFNEAEAIIESAIRSKGKRFTLNLLGSYWGMLPDSIGDILSLEELTICNKCIRGYGVDEIPESIGNLRSLEFLYIADC
ncbi:MAG: hypothetical protein GDA44_04385 [Prochloron sp. SP5CPC1]|nr:hypothetical protein [Candidatus Paraprochloron terpiosi SP5CPC1]